MLKNYIRGFYKVTNKDYSWAPSLNGNSKQRRQQRRKFERAVVRLEEDADAPNDYPDVNHTYVADE